MKGKSVKSLVRERLLCDEVYRSIPHVRVNDTAMCAAKPQFIELVRKYLAEFRDHSGSSYWLSSVPTSLRCNLQEVVNYLGMLVAIDFRHWGDGTERGDVPLPSSDMVATAAPPPPAAAAAAGSRVENISNFYTTLPPEGCDRHAEKGFGEGRVLRGSMAMVHILRCVVEQHRVDWYRPSYMAQFSSTDEAVKALECCFLGHEGDGKTPMWMPAARERVELLISISHALLEKDASFYKMWCRSEGYLYHPKDPDLGFIHQLLDLHPRYRDFCVLQADFTGDDKIEIPVLKLAQLTASAIESAISHMKDVAAHGSHHYADDYHHHHLLRDTNYGAFRDKYQLTICCDYQIPKALRFLGFIEYDAILQSFVDGGVLLEPGGVEETSIRVAALMVSEALLDYLCGDHHIFAGKENDEKDTSTSWDGPKLDHMLWWIGRHCADTSIKHHLCRTIMY